VPFVEAGVLVQGAQDGCAGSPLGGVDFVEHPAQVTTTSPSDSPDHSATAGGQLQGDDAAVGRIGSADQKPRGVQSVG
jgi:hypothetical protein